MMRPIHTLIFFILATLCHGAAVNKAAVTGGGRFTLREQRYSKHTALGGFEEMIVTYAKYHTELTPVFKKAVELNQHQPLRYCSRALGKRAGLNATVGAYPNEHYDTEFVVPVQIGTPPQELMLNLDTGSADLWAFSTDTPPNRIHRQKLYRPGNSSTARFQKGQTWAVQYGDAPTGEYRGVVPGHYINYGPINGTHCYGGIRSSEGLGFNIFGGVVLKEQFVVFDAGEDRIGFANKPTVPR